MTAGRSEDGSRPALPKLHLPPDLERDVEGALADWRVQGKVERLWRRDSSLWTGSDEAGWLGWLDIAARQRDGVDRLAGLARETRQAGFTHALLLGMGGSSLGPELLQKTFGSAAGFPRFHVLDSTDPAQVASFDERIDPSRTLFIVSSKSGSTLEPNIFKDYFFERLASDIGREKAATHFIAITDPGKKLEGIAQAERFRQLIPGVPDIGGRYSALSEFGMNPAAIIGIDIGRFLDRTVQMVEACGPSIPPAENPGVVLGAALGVGARAGRDKLTLFVSPGIAALGAWLEQLLAESTGKAGHAIIPVDGEKPAPPEAYGEDRLFAYLRLHSDPDGVQDAALRRLRGAGHAVIRIDVAEKYDLGQELFRWEIAAAVAGSILGINPFNQPDVEASKIATRKLTDEYERTGSLPGEEPIAEGESLRLFTDRKNEEDLTRDSGGDRAIGSLIGAHLRRISPGDYLGLLAYVERNEIHDAALQGIRHAVRDTLGVATCLGYGPRFLHSTGQAYKGGPNSGVFLQITCDDRVDLPVPNRRYTFGIVKAAQARGDFQVLAERGRRALRVHLGPDVAGGLAHLKQIIMQALQR